MGNQHPRFAAWVNPAAAPIGMLAEFLAAVMNPSAAGGDHAAIYLEHCVVRWLMELIDFPVEDSAGTPGRRWFGGVAVLPGGGTPLGGDKAWLEHARGRACTANVPPLVLYVSEEGHSCLRKASHLLGLGEPRRIRSMRASR